jgi:hypothetical protein
LDEEERKFQELQKELVIKRANKLLFDSQDAVKSFHSKLAIADAFKEREYQKEIKKQKEEIQKEIEEEHLQELNQRMIDYDRRELKEKQILEGKRAEQMDMVNSQLKESKIKKIKEYQDRVIEGEIIKKRAAEQVEEEKQKIRDNQVRIAKMNEEFVADNIKLEKLREEKKLKEAIEEKKIEDFAIKKEQLLDLRRRKEQEKFEEKQRLRQVLIDKQVEYLKNLKNREDEILAKHHKEAEAKRSNELAEKQKRFDGMRVSKFITNITIILSPKFRNKSMNTEISQWTENVEWPTKTKTTKQNS